MHEAKKTSKGSRLTPTLLLGSMGLLISHALYFNFLNDDAFISFRYADNLVTHGQLVFNPDEYVEGYTNFLWTLLMAGVLYVGLDPALWSRVLGIGFALVTLWVVTRVFQKVSSQQGPGQVLPAFLLAGSPAYACWATGGLETQMFTTFTTLGWATYLESQASNSHLRWTGLWLAMAAMTRPEGILVGGLIGLAHIASRVSRDRNFRVTRVDLIGLATFLSVFTPYFIWRWWYYGWPMPNTYYVKAGAGSFWSPGWNYFLTWILDHGLFLAPVLLVSVLRKHRHTALTSILIILGYSVHVIRVGGDFMGLHRFLVPIMPIMAVLISLGLVYFSSWLQAKTNGIFVGALVALLVIFAALHVRQVDRKAMEVGSENGIDRIGWLKMFHGQCTAIGRWLHANADKDASLATTAAGIIPYYSKLYTVDILGLNDEWVAHNVPAHGSRPGHTKSAPRRDILEKNVDYLIYHPTITQHPTRINPNRHPVLKTRGYQWRSIKVPDLSPPWWGFWSK